MDVLRNSDVVGLTSYNSNANPSNISSNIFWYMQSGHVPTEPYRPGFKGPYALVFSQAAAARPTGTEDLSFMGGIGLAGYVPVANRGYGKPLATTGRMNGS